MTEPVTFVCFKWRPRPGYRSTFTAESVNVLARMVARNYRDDHYFCCVTDDAAGISPDVQIIPLWDDYAQIPSPHGGNNPSCYRRLKLFSVEARDLIGERIVSLDLDCVITADITGLFDWTHDFRIWGDTARGTPYNGSMMMLRAGARRQVWDNFDPRSSPHLGRRRGYIGSDQAWIAVCLGPSEVKWTRADGVYSFRNEILPPRGTGQLPENAKVVMFHGLYDPWDPEVQARFPWVKEHWR